MKVRIYGTPQYRWLCNHADLDTRIITHGDTKNVGKKIVEVKLMGPRGGEKASLQFSRSQAEELGHALLTLAQEV